MKRYFIEIIAKATETNPNFAGTIVRYVYGKKEEMVARNVIEDPNDYAKYGRSFDMTKDKYTMENYGYTSRARAEVVARKVHQPVENNGYWEDKITIVEVEI